MDQRVIVPYPARKGLATVAISEDYVATLGGRRLTILRQHVPFEKRKSRPRIQRSFFLNRSVNMMIATRQSARLRRTTICVNTAIRVTHSLTKNHSPSAFHVVVGVPYLSSPMGPHRPSDAQKSNRVELSRALLFVLSTQQGRRWHEVITFNES
jgi:hypothetical protein